MTAVPDPLNFDWVAPGLAVGGSFPAQAVQSLARDHAVVAVSDAHTENVDDAGLMARHSIAFLHLPTGDTFALAGTDLDAGVPFAVRHRDAGQRLLIHCEHGIGRSALLALCVLVARGAVPLDALEAMKSARAKVLPIPHQFACWLRWLARQPSPASEAPAFEAFAAIDCRHAATS